MNSRHRLVVSRVFPNRSDSRLNRIDDLGGTVYTENDRVPFEPGAERLSDRISRGGNVRTGFVCRKCIETGVRDPPGYCAFKEDLDGKSIDFVASEEARGSCFAATVYARREIVRQPFLEADRSHSPTRSACDALAAGGYRTEVRSLERATSLVLLATHYLLVKFWKIRTNSGGGGMIVYPLRPAPNGSYFVVSAACATT